MYIPPSYQITKKITQLLSQIEGLKTQLDLLPFNKRTEKYTRQKSLLKSSLFSARIEGNPQTLEELERAGWTNSQEKEKLEIANLYNALEWVVGESWRSDITTDQIRRLHERVMKGLSAEAGSFRSEPSAIYNSAGIAVYICPLPAEIRSFLSQLLGYLNRDFESIQPIKVALCHIVFEKIHPFLDGNGRVGRLLIHLVLKKGGYDFRGLAPIEEFLDNNRQTYYDLLAENKQDRTEFVEFFLEGLTVALRSAVDIQQGTERQPIKPEDELPPRRLEILHIIQDHKMVSVDFIRRRFAKIPERTLRYDLNQLVRSGFIRKQGITRGVVYRKMD